jgi:hypothetical protein
VTATPRSAKRTREHQSRASNSATEPQHVRDSIDAEQHVLGALLLEPAAWHQVDIINPDDFSRSDHRFIFAAIAELASQGKPWDVLLVSKELERADQLDAANGLPYLSRLARETTTAATIRPYAELLRDCSLLRQLQTLRAELGRGIDDKRGVADLVALARATAESLGRRITSPAPSIETLPLESVSKWAARPPPGPRDFVIAGLIPGRRVSSFLADGGLGKTTITTQIGVHVAVSRAIYGLEVSGGAVLGLFCEDEVDEVDRKVRAACDAERIELDQVDRFVAISREGMDNLLCWFEHDQIVLTPFYHQLEATIAAFLPRLLILDTLADFFGGDYLSTPHVRQFVKTALGRLCVRYGCAILLVAHPSASAMSSGDGGGFSTAWNNSVRSRMYLRRPQSDDKEAVKDRRILEVRKANYGPSGVSVPLIWRAGAFVPDQEPVEEVGAARPPKVDTGLAIATRDYFLAKAGDGSVLGFRTLLEALQGTGALPKGSYQTVRKPLQRVLKELELAESIVASQTPRGYRLAESLRGLRGHSGDNTGTVGTPGTGDNGDTPIRGVSPLSPHLVPGAARAGEHT